MTYLKSCFTHSSQDTNSERKSAPLIATATKQPTKQPTKQTSNEPKPSHLNHVASKVLKVGLPLVLKISIVKRRIQIFITVVDIVIKIKFVIKIMIYFLIISVIAAIIITITNSIIGLTNHLDANFVDWNVVKEKSLCSLG